MRAFDNPSPSLETRIGFPHCYFLTARFDVRLVVPPTEKPANVLRVVTFVEGDVLLAARRRLRTCYRNAVKGGLQKLDIVRVGATDFNTQGHAAAIGKDRPLGSQLATIGRVFPGFFPRPVATWSSPRPRFASSSRSLGVRHTPRARLSTAERKHRIASILGSNDARCCRKNIRGVPLSTGSPSAAHKRCHRQFFSNHCAADHPKHCTCTAAITAGSAAKVHRVNATRTDFVLSPLETPPCWHKMNNKTTLLHNQNGNGSFLG